MKLLEMTLFTIATFALGAGWHAWLVNQISGRRIGRGAPQGSPDAARLTASGQPARQDKGLHIPAVCYGGPLDGLPFQPEITSRRVEFRNGPADPDPVLYLAAARSDPSGRWVYVHSQPQNQA